MAVSIGGFYRRWDRFSNSLRHRVLTATPLRHVRSIARRWRMTDAGENAGSVTGFADLVADGVQPLRRGDLGAFGLDEEKIARLARIIPASGIWADGRTNLEGDKLVGIYPDAYHLGLAPALLDLVETYLGQACLYLGASIKREIADGSFAGTRMWHLDVEDERMVRILVYLTPVEAGSGPFEYVEAGRTASATAASGYRTGFISDDSMAAIVPRSDWQRALGGAGDGVLFDGTRIFHRAQPPRTADRYSITLAYVSRRPLQLRQSAKLSRRCRELVTGGLSARAAACIPPSLPEFSLVRS